MRLRVSAIATEETQTQIQGLCILARRGNDFQLLCFNTFTPEFFVTTAQLRAKIPIHAFGNLHMFK